MAETETETAKTSENSTQFASVSEPFAKVDLTNDGGVIKQILRAGTGKIPNEGYKVSVHYVGRLNDENGEKFDSSRDRNLPFEFKLGRGHVIKGWDIGVATMREGELATLTCRSDYAYGNSSDHPSIPPNSTLYFEVELLSFQIEPETIADRVLLANVAKDQGNAQFKLGNYAEAVTFYDKGIEYFKNCWGIKEEEEKQMNEVKLSLHLNLSVCKLKLRQYRDCMLECEKALDIDASNVKAIFRRGQARLKLCEFEGAREDLEMALEASPNDAAIKAELKQLNVQEAAAKKNEKRVLKAMFSAVGSDDDSHKK